jgi:anti-sigma-K factor RskA
VNIKEYIESGILEAYVLGALTEQERAQVDADIALYPELAGEVEAIEMAMQLHANETSVTPPAFMQEKIWNAIQAQQPVVNNITEQKPAAKVVEFTPPVARPAWQRAAVWAAVLVSVITNFVLLSQRNQIRTQNTELAARLEKLESKDSQMLAKVESYDKGMNMIADTGMKTIVMRSAKPGHEMTGMVFWSKAKGETYLAIHNMPMPEKGKQYQLWVIQDGKPVSMGVIDNNLVANAGTMFKVPMNVTGGQAFAISLEKEGGNATPTEVMVVGAI